MMKNNRVSLVNCIRLRLLCLLKPWRYKLRESVTVQYEGFMYIGYFTKFVLDEKSKHIYQVSTTHRQISK